MSKFQNFKDKMKASWNETDDFRTKSGEATGKFVRGLWIGWRWVYRLRSVILGLPVAIYAVVQAVQNMSELPEVVGIGLQSSGEFALLLNRPVAALAPLAVTAVCLLMMFCSRKVFYPWLVSLFSLLLPVVILYSNLLLK